MKKTTAQIIFPQSQYISYLQLPFPLFFTASLLDFLLRNPAPNIRLFHVRMEALRFDGLGVQAPGLIQPSRRTPDEFAISLGDVCFFQNGASSISPGSLGKSGPVYPCPAPCPAPGPGGGALSFFGADSRNWTFMARTSVV